MLTHHAFRFPGTLFALILSLICATACTDPGANPDEPVYPATYCDSIQVTSWKQAELYSAFVDAFYVQKNLTVSYGSFASENYIQHNPDVGQGPAAAIEYLWPLWQKAEIKILHVGFDGGIGWIHNRVDKLGPQPLAITDVYRFNGSCIVEHWDVIQALPANATNPLALF